MKHINESIIGRKGISYQKYELTDETINIKGHVVYHIRAIKDIPSIRVKKGDLGGWIESYDNLDQKGDCWVADDAVVYNNAKVYGGAKVYNSAIVFGDAKICGNAKVDYDINKGMVNK